MSGSYCHITIYPNNQWPRFETGYNPEFINAIKRLPSYRRQWEPLGRFWTIDPSYYDMLMKLAQEVFNTVIVIENGQARELSTKAVRTG